MDEFTVNEKLKNSKLNNSLRVNKIHLVIIAEIKL